MPCSRSGITDQAIPWLIDGNLALFSITVAEVWSSTSVFAILILAGLLAMPQEPVEAAHVDGCTPLADLPLCTWPYLMPFAFIAMTIRSLDVARAYDIVKIMTDGGPAKRTELLVDAGRPHRLQRCPHGDGQCHGLFRDPAVDRSSPSISSASSQLRASRSELSGNGYQFVRTACASAGYSLAYLIGLFLAMLIICLPGFWIVLSSLRPTVEIMAKPPVWIPQDLSLDAYRAMFSGAGRAAFPSGPISAIR
jgi:hypothetical protein